MALILLMKLRLRAMVRRMIRGLKTPRGMIIGGLGALILFMWLGPALVTVIFLKRPQHDLDTIRAIAPLAMLGFCVLSLLRSDAGKALIFSPAEIDLLFPAPFSRRQLLAYKLAGGMLGSLVIALFFAMWLQRHAAGFVSTYLALVLGLIFLQLFSVILSLTAQIVTEKAFTRTRKLALIAIAAVIAVLVFQAMRSHVGEAAGRDWIGIARGISDSFAGKVVLAPFSAFALVLTAESWLELGLGTLIALLIDIAMFLVILRLDANYMETALATSQRVYEQAARIRRGGGGVTAMSARKSMHWRLPLLPFMYGAGPMAWRQLLTALRNSRGLMIVILLFGGSFVAFMLTAGKSTHTSEALIGPMIGWLAFMLPMLFRFDFRGDLDHLAWLKTLPLRPVAIAAGQLIAPLLVLSIIDLGVIGGWRWWLDANPLTIGIAAMAVVPFNLLLLATENFFFLLFPLRPTGSGAMDLQAVGRSAIILFARMFALSVPIGLSVGVGGITMLLLEGSKESTFVVAALAGSVTLLLCGLASVPAVGWAFARFDPASDTPA